MRVVRSVVPVILTAFPRKPVRSRGSRFTAFTRLRRATPESSLGPCRLLLPDLLQGKSVMSELMEVCVVLMEFFAFVLAATACACVVFVLFFWAEELIRSATAGSARNGAGSTRQ